MTGIYEILNIITGKSYIGQAVNIEKRLKNHKDQLKKGNHSNTHLQHSHDKYGIGVFDFRIIEECCEDDLDEKEKEWISAAGYETGKCFNLREGGNGGRLSEYTKQKIKIIMTGKKQSLAHRENMSTSHKGKVLSEDHKLKLSEAAKGRIMSEEDKQKIGEKSKGRVMSEEAKKKLSAINKGKKMSQESINKTSAANKGKKHSKERILQRVSTYKANRLQKIEEIQ